jgi:ribosomal protein L3 glutamine methyltransferase
MRPAQRRLATFSDLVNHGTQCFRAARVAFGQGTTNAFDEAVYLTLHALGQPLDRLEEPDRRLTERQIRTVRSLFERRIRERVPAAYLTGEAWLGDRRFRVDRHTIIPRSFIAELLRDDLAPWVRNPPAVRTVLDLCTGSGCLAVLLALSFPRAAVDAADISPDALKIAHANVADYRLQRRVRLIESDLFSALAGRRYDLIVSNPPYVTARAMRRLPREFRHEPASALAGGADGLDFVRQILAAAAVHLTPRGLLVVETGHSRYRVERAFPQLEFTWPLTSGGDDCVFLLERSALAQLPGPTTLAKS